MFTTLIAVCCLLVRIFPMYSSHLNGKKKHIDLRVKKSKLFSGDFVSFGKQDKYRRKRDLLAEFILETNYPTETNYALIRNGNMTQGSPMRSVIIRVINKIGRQSSGSPICLITSMITDQIGLHEVRLPDNHNHHNLPNRNPNLNPLQLPG